MKETLFITGLTSELGESLRKNPGLNLYKIIALSRKKNKNETNLQWVQGDLNNISSFSQKLSECDTLIHLGGITHSAKPRKYFEINEEAGINLFKEAQKAGIKKIIYISSYTAGEKSGAYGRSKFRVEKFLESEMENWLIIRPSEIFGTSKPSGIDQLVKQAINKKFHFYPKKVPLKLKPLHIQEAGEILYQVISNSELNRKRINVLGPEALSIEEILRYSEDFKKSNFTLIPIPKSFLWIAVRIAPYLPIPLGLVPDQIPRLYRPKNHLQTDLEITGKRSFLKYLKSRLQT